MTRKPVAVVTGAYRGLGLETCRQLASLGYRVVLTARREVEGSNAVSALRDAGADVRFHSLDVTNADSIQALAKYVSDEFDRLDTLVNNAGIFSGAASVPDDQSVFNASLEAIRRSFEINTLAPLRLCQTLIPLMRGRGCVVNVSSGMGQLSDMNGCCPDYRLSKTALNAVTRIFADELQDTAIKVNSVCPGWVRTEMGGTEAPLSVEEGAKGILWAATLPEDGPSGGFFRHGEPIAW